MAKRWRQSPAGKKKRKQIEERRLQGLKRKVAESSKLDVISFLEGANVFENSNEIL